MDAAEFRLDVSVLKPGTHSGSGLLGVIQGARLGRERWLGRQDGVTDASR